MAVSSPVQPAAGMHRRLARIARDPSFWSENAVYFGLLGVVVLFSLATPAFLTRGNIENLLVAAAILVVISTGQAFVISSGGIDLSVAANLTVTSVLLGFAVTQGWGLAAAVVIAPLGGLLIGALNGLVITKVRISDFVVTLGTLGVMTGLSLIISGGNPILVQNDFMRTLAIGSIGPIRYFVLIGAAVALIGHYLFFHSKFGTHLLATGGSGEAAREMGIGVDRVRIAAYMISGFLAGLGAIMLVSRTGAADPVVGADRLLNSIAAAVLGGGTLAGGRGSVLGTVAGALLLTVLLNGFTLLQVSESWQPLAVGLIVVAAAVLSRFQR